MLFEGLTVNPKRGTAGTLFHVTVRTRNAAGTLTNPGTSMKIQFIDASGALTPASLTSMTADSTGVQSYPYQSATSRGPGEMRISLEAIHTDGTSTLITDRGDPRNFEVV